MKDKNLKEKADEQTILTTLPAKRRLIFRWCEFGFVVLLLLAIWLVFARNNLNAVIVGVFVAFLVVFFFVGIWISFVLRKKTKYRFTKHALLVRSGIAESVDTCIEYSKIACYRKIVGIPDILTKRETATFKIYRIKTKRNGKKRLVQDMICSMPGVKKHKQISKIFNEANVIDASSLKVLHAQKKKLRQEWRDLKKQWRNEK